jgi:transcription antitermination factor NusB
MAKQLRKETQARELALQALYQQDLLKSRTVEELRSFCSGRADTEVAQMAMGFVRGCLEHRRLLDQIIRQTAENWELERMAASDRNILRLGVYELLFRPQTPPKVAMNEAIELAKKYITENSPMFINGVLDRIYNTRVNGRLRPDPLARADLHVHSSASDGSDEPHELPRLAAKAGLAAIALTDHDTVEGVAAARAAASEHEVLLIAGVELSAYADVPRDAEDVEIHIVGLFVDPANPGLIKRLEELLKARQERAREMARKLKEVDVIIDAESIIERAGAMVGRVHVARQMVERGYCSQLTQAFDRYLSVGSPAYVPKVKISPAEAIDLVHSGGGCAVLCHPGRVPELDERLAQMVEEGLDAIEVHYPNHGPEVEKRLLDLARRHDLMVSGGSDYHGANKPHISLGQETVSFVELHLLRQQALALV